MEEPATLDLLENSLAFINQLSKHPEAEITVVDQGEAGKFRRIQCTVKKKTRLVVTNITALALDNKSPRADDRCTFPLFISSIGDLVAGYFGFHHFDHRKLFREMIGCSLKTYREFQPLHPDLAVESFKLIQPFFFDWKCLVLKNMTTQCPADFSFEPSRFQLPKHAKLREKDKQLLYDHFPEFIAMLLHWSLLFDNSSLHAALWTTARLQKEFFNPVMHWCARFSACLKLKDLEQFRRFVGELYRDKRCEQSWGTEKFRNPGEKILHDFFMTHWLPQNESEQAFLLQLLDENLIPVTRSAVLLTLHDQHPEYRKVVLDRFRTRTLQHPEEDEYEDAPEENSEAWEEGIRLFTRGQYEDADRIFVDLRSQDRRRLIRPRPVRPPYEPTLKGI